MYLKTKNMTYGIIHQAHFEGSVHKGSISFYFRFWVFYTIRQISTSPTRLWRQFF